MMRKNTMLAVAAVGFLSGFATGAQAVHREDVLECALPDGSRATLTAGYDWSALAEVIPADISKRLNQEAWKIRFDASGGRAAQYPPRSIPHVEGADACSHVGAVDGILLVNGTYLQRSGMWFDRSLIPKKLTLYAPSNTQPPGIRTELQAMGAMPVSSYSLIVPRNGRLVFERPLIKIKGNGDDVIAVFQSLSTDDGVSWSDPTITRQAEIFVLDRPFSKQPFLGRAVRLNGKPVAPDRSGK